MSDTPETLSAILAEFRAFALRAADEDKTISPESVLLLADKVEAAEERERRKYERLHECFWSDGAIQNIVRQLLDERNDLRNQNPKASEVAAHFAQLLTKATTPAPGNAAALREALEYIAWKSRNAINSKTTGAERANVLAAYLMDFRDTARAALAAPARNCDVGTAEEQKERFKAFCEERDCYKCPFYGNSDCPLEWAQMPFATAEGGAE